MMHIKPFWNDEYTRLEYISEEFNNPVDVDQWLGQGYNNKFTGLMCDMRSEQPSWNQKIVDYFADLGWKNIGTSYYCMKTGTVLPKHSDTYKKYISLFDLKGRESQIHRAIVFLEDWKSGHYFEVYDRPVVDWKAGDIVVWSYNTPHMAANLGLEDRYTLQITGHY